MIKIVKLCIVLISISFVSVQSSSAMDILTLRTALPVMAGPHLAPVAAILQTPTRNGIETVTTAWTAFSEQQAAVSARGQDNSGTQSAAEAERRPASRPTGVFGSVAIPFRSLPSAENWRGIQPAVAKGLTLRCDPAGACPVAQDKLARALRALPGKSLTERLSRINQTVNAAIAYVPDSKGYGKLDYWASPSQILDRGQGDCEDYAILKMAALKTAGIPEASMSIVVVKDRQRRVFHAVLSVSTTQGHFILDNLDDRVLLDTDIKNYLPLYSVSTDRSWIHGRKRGDMQVASVSRLPDNLAPGEGFTRTISKNPISTLP